jgi:hypothetical protein
MPANADPLLLGPAQPLDPIAGRLLFLSEAKTTPERLKSACRVADRVEIESACAAVF